MKCNKRNSVRVNCNKRGELFLGDNNCENIELINISEWGIAFKYDNGLNLGELVFIIFILCTKEHKMTLSILGREGNQYRDKFVGQSSKDIDDLRKDIFVLQREELRRG